MIKRTSKSSELYKHYVDNGGKHNYETYSKVICYFNKYVFDEMIYNARALTIGKRLGKLCCATIWRNFNNVPVNWLETNKLKKQGIDQKVYYIDDYSVKIYYFRGSYKNRKYYKFKPTRGEIGNIHKLIQANQDDPLLYKDYLQVNK